MASNRIYIGRLSRDAQKRDVEDLFTGSGQIRDVNLKNGFGFVEFEDNQSAEEAVTNFNGKELLGERIVVELAKGTRRDDRRPRRNDNGPRYGVIVENLAVGTSWQDLKDFMRKAGEVSYADVRRDRDGEGIVEFSSYDSMKNALKELDGVDLKGPPRNRYRSRSPRDRRRDEKSSSKDTRRRRSDSQEDDRRSSRRDRDSNSRRSERRDSEE
ncbi:hypothetical protein K450DRAFT_255186 [Umbelopsis ramanniana AG]|uniref:RRM domain-containing protein n=1 Tax=Umbelopsis ramanniana AG TaxID=1314678 RepID=A0AAD5HAE9_UMBRA|nr:uncharacterized protein K450DRAFT_255186 [Umbelopsis ramanniana AG]KAI8576827.1 hypothetical protein K450DRAFT_255186 [Umbelopsis ramanniana AG]